MPVRRPSADELVTAARAHHFEPAPEELEAYAKYVDATLQSFDRLDELVEPKLPVTYPRATGYRPTAEENIYGAWAWRCSVKGAPEGPLAGMTVAVKDNVSVAGVPLLNGSAVMQGFVSDVDATIVRRLLDAGAEITGKATCENFCFSGASNTSFPGPVLNPHDPSRMTAGSSSGSGALLAAGECDLAIGADQGGSIREPAAYCGVFGLKATFGLVPYTGVGALEPRLDHVGPMARTVEELALMLEVIAGLDGLDPRQAGMPADIPQYSRELERDLTGLRIGVVAEGFGWPQSEPEVDDGVRAGAERFTELGAELHDVSIPMHRDAVHLFSGVCLEGAWATMVRGETVGKGLVGYCDTHQLDFVSRARRARAGDFSHQMKVVIMLASYMADAYGGRYYSKAQNLRRALTAAYEAELDRYDLLLMPSVPQRAIAFDETRTIDEHIATSLSMIHNTCGFNLSGHPALSVPCGKADGLPIGLMLIGRHWDEPTILSAAHAFEQLGVYSTEPVRRTTEPAVLAS
jgi:amidase